MGLDYLPTYMAEMYGKCTVNITYMEPLKV